MWTIPLVPLLLLSILSAGSGTGALSAPRDATMISRAVFADGRLWLRTDDGALQSLGPSESSLRFERGPGSVLDICRAGARVEARTAAKDRTWALSAQNDGGWTRVSAVPGPEEGEQPVALSCAPDRIDLLTTQRWFRIDHGQLEERKLSETIRSPLVSAVLVRADALFIGFNKGEWGGGMKRVDRASGKVTSIEQNDSGELCGGPLNAACDPVNAIVESPWQPGCVVAAVGLVHLEVTGRLVEVCGGKVRSLSSRTHSSAPSRSEAFFGLIPQGKDLLAVGVQKLYRVRAGTMRAVRTPAFKQVDGVQVSFALPDVVLVKTAINARASVSGAVPLLVPR
jgi:hypothetical protein